MKLALSKTLTRLRLGTLGLLQIAAAYAVVLWVFRGGIRLRLDRSGIKGLKPPFIILGNHTSNFDPALVQVALGGLPCYFLTSNYYFRLPVVGKILRIFGAIPKVQFSPDIRSLRGALSVLTRGDIVGIFPEGRRSIDGSCCPLPDSVARFVKKAKVPVVSVKTDGGYFIWPRWSSFWRPGRVRATAKLLFTPAQIEAMATEQLQDAICRELAYDDYLWNRRAKWACRHPKAAEGLHLILHQCPRCLQERVMRTQGTRLYCSYCGNSGQMDRFGFLQPVDKDCVIFDDPVKWTEWQKKNMLTLIEKTDFHLKVAVKKLLVADKFYGPFRSCGDGHLNLRPEGLYFHGRVDGQARDLFFPIQMLPSVSTEFRPDFEICDEKNAWWFFLEEDQQTVILESAIALLHQQNLNAPLLCTGS